MDARKIASNTLKVVLPLMLSGGILYWMYRGFDFDSIRDVLFNEMSWTWMLLSMPFGVLAQLFRAWRWRLALEPLGEQPRMRTTADSIFLSYALSLVVPRVGEVARCGVLRRYDGVSFAKAIGTVVTERMVDMVLMLLITALGFAVQLSVFGTFFSRTGTRLGDIAGRFTTAGWLVTAVCGVAAAVLLLLLLRRLSFYDKVRDSLLSVGKGIASVRRVKSQPRYLFYSLGIWASYFLHYYLTFFCFDFTANLGITCALVSFVVGTIAVIVPTPNGAGPWHFAVKTMLILYGVADTQALYFVLIVHTLQTLLVVLLGIWAAFSLAFTNPKQ